MPNWQAMAAKGDAWAVSQLLSRPDLDPEAEPYWQAFLELSEDRKQDFIGAGLGGGIYVPLRHSPKKLRKTGKRLGYEGDALVDFVRILQGIDRHYCETEASRSAAQLQRDAKKSRNTTGR